MKFGSCRSSGQGLKGYCQYVSTGYVLRYVVGSLRTALFFHIFYDESPVRCRSLTDRRQKLLFPGVSELQVNTLTVFTASPPAWRQEDRPAVNLEVYDN